MNNETVLLKSLIETNNWLSVQTTLLSIYPEETENIESYREAFEKLKYLEIKESDFILCIIEDLDDETQEIIFQAVYCVSPNEENAFALEFMDWNKVLGSTISSEMLENYNEIEIIAHSLYEMTYIGFDEEEIQNELKNMENLTKELENMVKEEKDGKTSNIEYWMRKIDNKKTGE